MTRPHARALASRTCAGVVALLVAASPATSAKVIDKTKQDPAAAPAATANGPRTDASFLRVADDDGLVALEIASRRYERTGEGPDVTLTGVVHIGEAAYYRTLQRLLEEHDVVLYESVKPAGAGGAGGESDEERLASTKAALRFAASLVELHRAETGGCPPSLDALQAFAAARDPRLAAFLDAARRDAWEGEVTLVTAGEGEQEFSVVSLGADGAPGGQGIDADLAVSQADGVPPFAFTSDGGIQAQLAAALDLTFQLDAIDYGRPRWRCSDMSIDAVQRSMERKGSDFTILEDTLAGTSLPAQLAKVLLGVMRFADALFEGAVSDMVKVLLIEMLGDESLIDASLAQIGPGFAEVIIGERNQVVIDDLERIIAEEPAVRSVAVLYGAGHMPDLQHRLAEQLSYAPTEARWERAIEVDTRRSAISEAELNRLRLMMRRMMRQMAR